MGMQKIAKVGRGGTTTTSVTQLVVYGTFYQGSAVPVSGAGTTGDPYVYPAKLDTHFALSNTEDITSVDDWSKYDLLKTFEHGDPLPNNMPTGLGYLRLGRGSDSLNGSSWDADSTTVSYTDPVTGNLPSVSRIFCRNADELWIYYDTSVTMAVSGAPVSGYFTITTDSSAALTIDTVAPFVGTGGTTSPNLLKFHLSRDLDGHENVYVDIVSGLAKDSLLQSTDSESSRLVDYWGAYKCYIMVINNTLGKHNRAGDGLYVLFDRITTIPDLTDAAPTRKSYSVIPLVSQNMYPQRGWNEGMGDSLGGGIRFTHIFPTAHIEAIQLGYNGLSPGRYF
jgi:hypothetical protein